MVNKVILVGRLGRDPEVVDIGNGVKKASFGLATNEVYRDRQTGDKKEITDWHNVVLWRRQAEIAEQYMRKGDLVYIEGRLKSRKYTDQNGVEKYITEVLCDNFQMLSSRGGGADQSPSGGGYSQSAPAGSSSELGGHSSAQPPQSSQPSSSAPDISSPQEDEDDLPF